MSKHVERGEVLGLAQYEGIRDNFRTRIIGEKKKRRVKLGDRATILFENHDTALLQIQEMLRTERISREDAVLHEVATYNELLGGPHDLGATMMIEIDDNDERVRFLESARGLPATMALTIGGESIVPTVDPAREHPDRLSAVVYLVFSLTEKALQALAQARKEGASPGVAASLKVDHASYKAEAALSSTTVYEIAQDFA